MPRLLPTRLATSLALILAVPPVVASSEAPAKAAPDEAAPPSRSPRPAQKADSTTRTIADSMSFGVFGELARHDAPHASAAYTANFVANQQADGLADALQVDPALRSAEGWADFTQVYAIRGFPLYADDIGLNGLPGLVPSRYVAAELFDRIEIIRGANALMRGVGPGRSGVGGAINLVSKRAPAVGLRRVTLGLQGRDESYGALDVGQRFGRSDAWGLRVNGVRREGEGAIDDEQRRLSVAALGMDYAGTGFSLSVDVAGQKRRVDAPRPDVFSHDGLPRPPSAEVNFAQPWTFLDERDAFGSMRAEFDLGDRARGWIAAGARRSEDEGARTFTQATGSGGLTSTSTYVWEEVEARSIEVGMSLDVQAAHGTHTLSIAATDASLGRRDSRVLLGFDTDTGRLDEPRALPRPFLLDSGLLGLASGLGPESSNDRRSVAVADTMVLRDGRLLVTAGLRHQRLDVPVFDPLFGTPLGQHSDNAITPSAGFSVRRDEHVSIYGNYAEALEPMGFTGEDAIPSLRSRQIEVGLRYDADGFGATAALFRIVRPDAIAVDGRVSSDGEQRNVGVEVGFVGEPIEGLRLMGGVSVLDAEQVRTQDGTFDGRDVIGVPGLLANLHAEWDVPAMPGVTVETLVVHTGSQAGNASNSIELDAWTRWDLGIRYAVTVGRRPITLRARVENVGDTTYWQSVGGYRGAYNLVLASPRRLSVSATFDF